MLENNISRTKCNAISKPTKNACALFTSALHTDEYSVPRFGSFNPRRSIGIHQIGDWVGQIYILNVIGWRIEAAEMKLLRPLVGYAFYDYKTNDSIRLELQTDCILDKIDEYRMNWLLHLQRMPQNRIPLKSYLYSPQGKTTIGRPNKRWR